MTNMAQFQIKGSKFEFKWLMPKMLKTDSLYQHEINQNRVAKIISSWDYNIVNPPKISQRSNGEYYVIDGQHTVTAWKLHEGENAPILCKVYTGLTWADEKDMFVKQNGISADPTTAEKLRAEYNANNTDVRGMYNTCAEYGVKVLFIGHGRKTRYSCVAVSALFGCYMSMPKKDFARMLTIITKAWDGEPLSLSAGFLKGFKSLFKLYSDRIKDSEMTKSLSKYTPEYYVREAREIGGSLETKFSAVFLRVYNKNRTTGRLTA